MTVFSIIQLIYIWRIQKSKSMIFFQICISITKVIKFSMKTQTTCLKFNFGSSQVTYIFLFFAKNSIVCPTLLSLAVFIFFHILFSLHLICKYKFLKSSVQKKCLKQFGHRDYKLD